MSQSFLTEIGDFVFDTVFGFFNSMISVITGGAITDFLGGYSELAELLDDTSYWLADEVSAGLRGVADFTQAAWVDNMNTSHSGLMDVLDLSNYIEGRYEEFYREAEGIADEMTLALLRDAEREQQTGEVLADFALESLLLQHSQLGGFTDIFYESIVEDAYGISDRFGTIAEDSYSLIDEYLTIDLEAVLALAEDQSAEAAKELLAKAEVEADFIEAWFLETVVKPINYAEAMAWAQQAANEYDIDEVTEQHVR